MAFGDKIQEKAVTLSATTSTQFTFDAPPTQGKLLRVKMRTTASQEPAANTVAGWVQIGSWVGVAGTLRSADFYKVAGPGESATQTPTVTMGANSSPRILAREIDIDNAVLDGTGNGGQENASGTTATTPSVTPTAGAQVLIDCAADGGASQTFSNEQVNGSTTDVIEDENASALGIVAWRKVIASASGSYQGTATISSGTTNRASIAAFRSGDTAPTAPGNLTSTRADGGFNANWDAPSDPGSGSVDDYEVEVYRSEDDVLVDTDTTGNTDTDLDFTGLTNGTAYYWRVRAHADNGLYSPWSAFSADVTPATTPSPPTIGDVSRASATSANVAFTPNSDGGSPPVTYRAISTPGGLTGTSSTSPVLVEGLTTGIEYTFTVRAQTDVGNSAESSDSDPITLTTGSVIRIPIRQILTDDDVGDPTVESD